MGCRRLPDARAIDAGQPLYVPIAIGAGLDHSAVHVSVNPGAGPLADRPSVTLALVTPEGAVVAFLALAEVAALQDQLDRATARLTSALTSKDHPNG